MAELLFNKSDMKQIQGRGMGLEQVISQIEIFKKGLHYSDLVRPCTVGDGIMVFHREDLEGLGEVFTQHALSARAMKFVPASGAATRMFKFLLSFSNRYGQIDEKRVALEAEKNDLDHKSLLQFIKGLKKFAFYEDLKSAMSQNGLDIETFVSEGQYKVILEYILTSKGLNLASLPKGLIKFHEYPDHARTPFEEHLVEAVAYTQDKDKIVRVHSTVSPDHQEAFESHIKKIRCRYENSGLKYEVTLSVQKPSTDTIAVDMNNNPFRDKDGGLLFRPGGHGALLENLSDLKGDMVFIKNIDNVVPDRVKKETYFYKRALGGYLVQLQKEIFGYLERLSRKDVDEQTIKQILAFARHKLSIIPPERVGKGSKNDKMGFLFAKLNRPLRVCGMVRNVGEPGGGPFWVKQADQTATLQIVEVSQVDMTSASQRAVWESATHFNPVDLVCGVRDYLGRPFNLMNFIDPNTGFISIKSKEGRELKALEHPGLWNGSMANWNTVFVEVPIITFNPVKTILDLLRPQHQPE
ncbi:MAG: DUF4301 family protein [Desulfatiglandales bacterium]